MIHHAERVPYDEKIHQKIFSLKHTDDGFRKVITDVNIMGARYIDNGGIGHINIIDFLADPKSIEAI